ncbi:tyrosine-type recombinase/integrase [Altererythrobacter sp. GH1-8]|uniref:tyrosine-type recombinase/integrase n=1 Tax=Altererythrobacter sp. GH1-8 TaxID=3349333 RepID=UPI00374CCE1E
MLTDTKIAAIKAPAKGQDEHPDHKVTGLRLRIGTSGKKVWTLRKRVGPKTINRKLGTYPAMKLASARSAAEKMLEALERDGSTEGIDRTFGEVARQWLEKRAKPNNKSWQLQQRQLERHVFPAWEHRKITEIKRRDARELISSLEGAILPNRVLALIKTIFRYALKEEFIDASPTEAMDKPTEETARDRFLNMQEVARIWAGAELLGYPMGQFLRMLLLTGQRRTEVAHMRWEHIDMKAATWIVPETKSDRANLVPLPPLAIEILKASPRFGPFVFTTNGETPISAFARMKTQIDRLMLAKNEQVQDWRLHDLRRTAATHMVRLGSSVEVVGRVLNHAAKGVTAQVYALHDFAPEKRRALEAWAAEVDRSFNGERAGNVVQLNG